MSQEGFEKLPLPTPVRAQEPVVDLLRGHCPWSATKSCGRSFCESTDTMRGEQKPLIRNSLPLVAKLAIW